MTLSALLCVISHKRASFRANCITFTQALHLCLSEPTASHSLKLCTCVFQSQLHQIHSSSAPASFRANCIRFTQALHLRLSEPTASDSLKLCTCVFQSQLHQIHSSSAPVLSLSVKTHSRASQFFIGKICTVSQKKFPPLNSLYRCEILTNLKKFLHCWKAYQICYKTHTTLPTPL